ncbi:MAG: hypothetical protein ACLSCQ_04345 [Evtepia gabavorous]
MSRFLHTRYAGLETYTPGEQPRDKQYIKLNTNESPIPPPRRFWRPWARGRWRTCGSTPTQRGPGCGRSWRGCTA